ncbi:peptide-methionine (S)-S-oxide reductase MsrA [Candidatus Gottesmanbacteria bacterium]|nr:peptide-methionine (S)-S-oxide reductase MsrA [Candidatus Gottesmanbacteria bacterium]
MSKTSSLATIAGGCFWCTEAIFKRLKGVVSVMPGFAGGWQNTPTYQDVCSGKTGHAEAVQIEFDPKIISFKKLLEVFWHLHDPTTLNQQGADYGTQYRSAIFYHDEEQKKKALDSKKSLEKSGAYKSPVVTEIVPFTNFYPAENYHQNYFDRNSYQPYCQAVIDPKIQKLYREFKKEVKPVS